MWGKKAAFKALWRSKKLPGSGEWHGIRSGTPPGGKI